MRSLVVALVFLAGCTQAPVVQTDVPLVPDVVEPQLRLELGGCSAAAAISIYPRDDYAATIDLPGNLTPLDLRGVIGGPHIVSANGAGWLRADGPITGHWHVAAQCPDTAAEWGFVGIAIEPPVFDDEPAELNILTAVWAWDEGRVADVGAWGHATAAHSAVALDHDAMVTMQLSDEHHGQYTSRFAAPSASTVSFESIRFWLLLPQQGMHNHHDQTGPFDPVSYDLHLRHMDALTSIETVGAFVHSGTDHHAPLPALGGNTMGLYWTMQDVVVSNGPRPELTLDTTWVH